MGELLELTIPHQGGRPQETVPLGNGFPKLVEIGVSRKESMQAQRFHALPEALKDAVTACNLLDVESYCQKPAIEP